MSIFYLLLWIILVIIVCVVAVAYYLHSLDKKYAHIPGPPKESFWFGNVPPIKSAEEGDAALLNYSFKITQEYGKTYKVRLMHRVIIVTVDPDVVKEIGMSGRHPKSPLLNLFFGSLYGMRLLGDKSILTETSIEKARWKRSHFNAMFNRSYFKEMSMDFNTAIEPLMRRLTSVADGKTRVTMLDEFNHVTLDVLAKIAFGLEINNVDSTSNPFTSAVFTTFRGLSIKRVRPFYLFNPMNWKDVLETRKAVHTLRSLGEKVIEERMSAKARGDYVPDDILSLIVEMKEKSPEVDVEELVDDFVTYFVAGQETTAGLLSFLILILGQNPEEMNRLQEEIDEVVGEKPVIDYKDLQNLTYLDMVIKETLRLYPPVAGAIKEAGFDVTVNGCFIPKGSCVVLQTRNAGKMEEYFENAHVFNPERFSPKAEKRVDPYVYFPFSIGPRTCLGKYFADECLGILNSTVCVPKDLVAMVTDDKIVLANYQMEAKIIMTKIIQRFEFTLDPDQSFEEQDFVTIRPKGRAAVTLTMRGGIKS